MKTVTCSVGEPPPPFGENISLAASCEPDLEQGTVIIGNRVLRRVYFTYTS